MSSSSKRIAVIGGGVAGLMASIRAASLGADVHLFEKMDRVGLKMGITGKGRCNLTNARPIREFIEMTPGNGRFLFSAYRQFNNEDLIALLNEWGLPTVVERGGRVFPESQDAQDVRHLFMRKLKEYGVHVHLEEPARRLVSRDGHIAQVVTDKRTLDIDAAILCTGGKSYPRTGSTGDGYRMAQELGHHVTTLRPALIPLTCAESYCKALQGLSLRNVKLTVDAGGKNRAEEMGEMLFTHFGISGPIVLSLSDKVSLWLSKNLPVKAFIDLKPALSDSTLDKRVLRDMEKHNLKQMAGAMVDLLPHRLIDVVLEVSGVPRDRLASELTRKERQALVHTLKNLPLTITGTRPLEEAIVTAGGVSTKEVNPSTMESRLCRGLYLAGEVLDVHAFTGGYNIQAAFSTGYTAATHAAEED
jgi:predicted Rossmann fold flavoprotein